MARLVVQSDIDTYGAAIIADGLVPMQLNDIIYFLTDINSSNGNLRDVSYPKVGARYGATIWIQGGATSYNGIELGSTTGESLPSDIDNPNRVHFFDGQLKVIRGATGLSGKEIQLINFTNLIVDFESNTYPGLRDGWGSGRSGTFGLRCANEYITEGVMALRIDCGTHQMKRLEIRGCELTMGSFAKIRAILAENHLERFIIERCLITRSVNGEGLYIAQTSRLPGGDWASLKNFIVRDNIFAFTAAEAMQLQEVCDGSRFYNNVLFVSDIDYKSAFQPFQDTGIQLVLGQGDVWFYNNVVVGWGSTGLHIFGNDLAQIDQEIKIPYGDGITKIFNNTFSRGKSGHTFRIHDSFDKVNVPAKKILIRDNDIPSSTRDYYSEIGDINNFHAEIDSESIPVEFIGGNFPNDGVPIINPGKPNTGLLHFNMSRSTVIPEPEFINTGFDGIDIDRITRWSETLAVGNKYANTHPDYTLDMATVVPGGSVSMTMSAAGKDFPVGAKVKAVYRGDGDTFYGTIQSYVGTTLIIENISHISGSGISAVNVRWDVSTIRPYTVGEFVWLADHGPNLPYQLYKCLAAHEANIGEPHTKRPEQAPALWELVQWDANGKNIYDPTYDGTPVTADFMEVAGDFRLVKGSYHHLKGRGLSCNEQRDDQTKMGWQWKQTADGTIRDIPGAYDHKLTFDRYSYLRAGVYYRFWVERLNNVTGAFSSRIYSNWHQI